MMASPQRQSRLYSIREHATAEIAMAKEEVEMAINNPIFVPGHNGWHRDIEDLLLKIAEYESIIEVVDKHFS
jgi:hypothetical protein